MIYNSNWQVVSTPTLSCVHTHTHTHTHSTYHTLLTTTKSLLSFWFSHSRHLSANAALSDLLHKTSWRGSQLVVKRLWFEVYTMVFYLWDG